MKFPLSVVISLLIPAILLVNAPVEAQRQRQQQPVRAPREQSATPSPSAMPAAPNLTEAQKKDIEETLQKAMERFQQGDFQKTAQLISLAENLNPALSPAGTMMAKWAMMLGNPTVARTLLDDAVAAHPDDPEAFLLLADIAQKEKRRTEATLLLARGQELLEKYSRSPIRKKTIEKAMWLNLAGLAELKRDYNGALVCLDKLRSEEVKDNADIFLRYGIIYTERGEKGDEEKALEAFEKVFKLDPEQLPAKAQLAQLLLQKGQAEKAEKLLGESAKQYPEHFALMSLVVGEHLSKGRVNEAQKAADTLKKLRPDSVDIDRLQGKLALASRNIAEADAAFSRVLEKLPYDQDANEAKVLILLDSGDKDKLAEANKIAEANLRRAPSNENAALLAWTFFQLEKKEQAERLADQVLARGLLTSNSAYFIAGIMAGAGKIDEARSLLQSSLQSPAKFFMRDAAEKLSKKLGPAKEENKQ